MLCVDVVFEEVFFVHGWYCVTARWIAAVAAAAVGSWPCDHGCWFSGKASLRTAIVNLFQKHPLFFFSFVDILK